MENNQGRELGFDDVITQDAQEFLVLTPGEYPFQVVEIEKSRSKGQGKLPPTNMVIVSCQITTSAGTTNIKEYLILHSSMEWKLSQFFASLGLKKKGEQLRMNWNAVQGSTGLCKVINEERDGNTYNRIKEFVLPANYDQSATSTTAGGWTPGSF